MKQQLLRIVFWFKEKILLPYKTDIVYTLLLFVLLCLFPFPIYRQIKMGNLVYVFYLIMLAYASSYVLCFLFNLCCRKIIRNVFLVILTVAVAFDCVCELLFRSPLNFDFIEIIANTNAQETKEFYVTYLEWYYFVILLLVVGLNVFVANRVRLHVAKKWLFAPFLLLFCAMYASYHNWGMVESELVTQENVWRFSFDEIVDLRNHRNHPRFEEVDSVHPENIVVILGESFAKDHSSLYGYEKCTNPLLQKLMDDGNLIAFSNVESPETHTTAAFKYILNTHTVQDKGDKKWYDYTNLIELLDTIGYYTVWVSNQQENGMFDNLPSGHSKLCKKRLFNSEEVNPYDGYLINALSMGFIRGQKRCGVFYHMYGQHIAFSERYPQSFDKFKPNDYPNVRDEQRQTFAEYDNATLYNDYVVSSIIRKYEGTDAVIFYFSDHGLDFYNTDPTYAGHAHGTPESKHYGRQIPFMVYLTDKYREKNPQKEKLIRKISNNYFMTDRFIYLFLDVVGYKLISKKRGRVKSNWHALLTLYNDQSPDFPKPGLCYVKDFLYLCT